MNFYFEKIKLVALFHFLDLTNPINATSYNPILVNYLVILRISWGFIMKLMFILLKFNSRIISKFVLFFISWKFY